MKKANNLETKVVDVVAFEAGVAQLKKAVELEISMTNDLSEVGKKFYEQKLFKEAAAIYEIAVTNINSKNYFKKNHSCIFCRMNAAEKALKKRVIFENKENIVQKKATSNEVAFFITKDFLFLEIKAE